MELLRFIDFLTNLLTGTDLAKTAKWPRSPDADVYAPVADARRGNTRVIT